MSGEPMTDPTPYVPEEGAGIYRLCDVPEGWEWRYTTSCSWTVRSEAVNPSERIVEARPPRPVMVEVSVDEVIRRFGRPNMLRTAAVAAFQPWLDAAWAEKDAAS